MADFPGGGPHPPQGCTNDFQHLLLFFFNYFLIYMLLTGWGVGAHPSSLGAHPTPLGAIAPSAPPLAAPLIRIQSFSSTLDQGFGPGRTLAGSGTLMVVVPVLASQ